MKNKGIAFLLVILILCLFIGIGQCFLLPHFPVHKNTFQLQTEYAQNLENKLVNLLEPATGIGNIRANVTAQMTNQSITKTQFNFQNATRTTTRQRGPVLLNQSVSVLINEKDKNKFYSYQNLIKSAIGFNPERGDSLNIELLPFVKVPLWTLGLSPLFLAKMATILILLFLIGLFWLIKEWLHSVKKISIVPLYPNKTLWQKAEKFPSSQWVAFLKTIRPEMSAFILYHLTKEKASEIIDLLTEDYTKQVILHLNYIEKLSSEEQNILLKQTEAQLHAMLKTFYPQTESDFSAFDQLETWQYIDIQKLLHYVSKKDLIMALKTAPLTVQHLFEKSIPSSLWQNLIYQINMSSCSVIQSYQAKEKIVQISRLLKEDS